MIKGQAQKMSNINQEKRSMNTQLKSILAQRLAKKGKKANGFTLIELMVVVAIVGILSAVGLPKLTAAQDKPKIAAAEAKLDNVVKECSLSLISNISFTAPPTSSTTPGEVYGTCAKAGTLSIVPATGVNPINKVFVNNLPS